MSEVCPTCGQLNDVPGYDEQLWETYHRIDDGRATYEPLVFDSEWLQENINDEDDITAVHHAMEKDMHNRGLCVNCGRPDLSGVDPAKIMSEEDAQEMHDMWAEQAAERRAGC